MEEHPSYEQLMARLGDLLAPCLAQDWPNLPVERAEGATIIGHDGRRYLDFLAGFAACNVGHNHPRVVAAARQQLEVQKPAAWPWSASTSGWCSRRCRPSTPGCCARRGCRLEAPPPPVDFSGDMSIIEYAGY